MSIEAKYFTRVSCKHFWRQYNQQLDQQGCLCHSYSGTVQWSPLLSQFLGCILYITDTCAYWIPQVWWVITLGNFPISHFGCFKAVLHMRLPCPSCIKLLWCSNCANWGCYKNLTCSMSCHGCGRSAICITDAGQHIAPTVTTNERYSWLCYSSSHLQMKPWLGVSCTAGSCGIFCYCLHCAIVYVCISFSPTSVSWSNGAMGHAPY